MPEAAEAEQPVLNGTLNLTASRIGMVDTGTSIRDLKRGSSLRERPTAFTLNSLRRGLKSPIRAMRLGRVKTWLSPATCRIHAGGTPTTLKISAPKLVFAETPLPGLKSGAAVGEISTNDIKSTLPQYLTVAGTVFNPELLGTIYLRNTDLRLPDTIENEASPGVFALPFSSTKLTIVARQKRTGLNLAARGDGPYFYHGPNRSPQALGNDPRTYGKPGRRPWDAAVPHGVFQYPQGRRDRAEVTPITPLYVYREAARGDRQRNRYHAFDHNVGQRHETEVYCYG